jgi:hypothetical protein
VISFGETKDLPCMCGRHGMKESWEKNEKEDIFSFHAGNDQKCKDVESSVMQQE